LRTSFKDQRRDITNIPSHIAQPDSHHAGDRTNLLTHTAEQTRNPNVVEAKVLNHTPLWIEIQLLENSVHQQAGERVAVADLRLADYLDKNRKIIISTAVSTLRGRDLINGV
ncbi:angiopoietin-1, partial [Lates japonicus]